MTVLSRPNPPSGVSSQTLVVIVEDQDLVLGSVAARLYETGYRVVTCASIPIAGEFLEQDRSGLVILPADAFYLHGDAIPEAFRKLSRTTRVLFLDREGDFSLFLEPLSTHLAIHPFESDHLEEAIREILGRVPEESAFGMLLSLPPALQTGPECALDRPGTFRAS